MKTIIANAVTAAMLAFGVALPDHIDTMLNTLDSRYQGAEQVIVIDRLNAPVRPNPNLSPVEVVTVTLEALKANDTPYLNAGIETAFRFSSPDNRESSGPLDEFVELVRGDVYAPMLNHQSARFGQLKVEGNDAWLPVVVVSETAERRGYTFRLTRQVNGAYDGCWMVEGVFPFDVEEPETDRLLVEA